MEFEGLLILAAPVQGVNIETRGPDIFRLLAEAAHLLEGKVFLADVVEVGGAPVDSAWQQGEALQVADVTFGLDQGRLALLLLAAFLEQTGRHQLGVNAPPED